MRKKVVMTHVLSELYMLTDKSPNFRATEEFVDRRLEDFEEVEQFTQYVLILFNPFFISSVASSKAASSPRTASPI